MPAGRYKGSPGRLISRLEVRMATVPGDDWTMRERVIAILALSGGLGFWVVALLVIAKSIAEALADHL